MAIVHGCDYLKVEDHFFTVYGTQEPENSIRAILNFYPAEEAGQNGRRESYQKHVNDVDAGYALQRCDFVEEDDIFHGLQVVPDNQVERECIVPPTASTKDWNQPTRLSIEST